MTDISWAIVLLLIPVVAVAVYIYMGRPYKPPRQQHHLDADPLGDAQLTLKRLRLEQHQEWDAAFNSLSGVSFNRALEQVAQLELYDQMEKEAQFHNSIFEYEKARDIMARLEIIKRLDSLKDF